MRNEITEKKPYNMADHYRSMLGLNLPDNFVIYAGKWYSNIQVNVCNTDIENGYGNRVTSHILLMRYCEKCNRCGYHSLWNPDDSESHCGRHTLKKGYETVFSYEFGNRIPLEQAFQMFLDRQSANESDPVVYFGL